MESNALFVFTLVGPFEGLDCFLVLVEFLVAVAKCIPHARVFGFGLDSLAEVVESVVVHVLEFVGLAQSIPGPEVSTVVFSGIPVGIDGPHHVLHFQVLMSH